MIGNFEGTSASLLELQKRAIGEIYIKQDDLDWALAQKKTIALQYLVDGRLAGAVIVANKRLRPWSALYFFAADPEFRSHKVAQSLLEEAENLCTRPSLRLFLRDNGEKAIGFFEKHGYTLRGVRQKHYNRKLNELIYMKKLNV